MFDETHYAEQTGLEPGTDLLAHYLDVGWRWGLSPRPGFDGAFLSPYYAASGWSGPPLLTHMELSILGGNLPYVRDVAEHLAGLIRASGLLDVDAYARRLSPEIDPCVHYVVVGEALGWRPSTAFDPAFYLERYPDIAAAGGNALAHYVVDGRREQRSPRAVAEELAFPPIDARDDRRAVLLLVHEASRTGAPLLGWSLVQHLSTRRDMVSVLLYPGSLEDDFRRASAATVGPMRYEHWHRVEMDRLAERLVQEYRPLYAVANSIETSMLVPALAKRGVPTVALVHEFAAYTRPVSKLADAFDWAAEIVFPARIVAGSAEAFSPHVARRRGVNVFPQGRIELPQSDAVPKRSLVAVTRMADDASFSVLGAGQVQVRKGVDIFISVAAAVKRLAPDLPIHFNWIGDGYNPLKDQLYSAYLAEQIARSGIADRITFLEPVSDLDPVYAASSVLLLSSRLDPQPNVGIDALSRGLPVVCFEGASGTAEVLLSTPETASLVAPHLSAEEAARIIIRLASDPALHAAMRDKVQTLADAVFAMDAYVARVDALGEAAAARLLEQDFRTLRAETRLDPDLILPPDAIVGGADELAWTMVQQWANVGLSLDQAGNAYFRRGFPGFNPQVYAAAHPDSCVTEGQHPLAHWLRAGEPQGPWIRRVLTPQAMAAPTPGLRVALHGHFYYPDLLVDLLDRLETQATRCDLFLTTDTDEKLRALRGYTVDWPGAVDIQIVPNRGRDVGPFLSCLPRLIEAGYEVVGHVHGKQSSSIDAGMGDRWRTFLWENLVGPEPVLDTICAEFANRPGLGLVMAEDPHLVGWDGNYAHAEALHHRMGLAGQLPKYLDFPLGTMFWARATALTKFASVGLTLDDYPEEPLPDDATVVHAIERLIPIVVDAAGFETASIRVASTNW